jgi:hypothetical protein
MDESEIVTYSPPEMTPHEELEYRRNVYTDGYFYPIFIGDTYRNQYIVLGKLGFGGEST